MVPNRRTNVSSTQDAAQSSTACRSGRRILMRRRLRVGDAGLPEPVMT
jgi:hypothetical protein